MPYNERMFDGDGVKPEGAEMRFAAHVIQEIEAGRSEWRWGWLHDEAYLTTPGRWDLEIGEEEAYNNTFELFVRSRWFGLARPAVYLKRGEFNIDLWDDEKEALTEAWQDAEIALALQRKRKKEETEQKRKRAAWWP